MSGAWTDFLLFVAMLVVPALIGCAIICAIDWKERRGR